MQILLAFKLKTLKKFYWSFSTLLQWELAFLLLTSPLSLTKWKN